MENVKHTFHSALESHLQTSKRPLIVVLGPTASGKTAFSIELGLDLQEEGFAPEIVNADSRQLYRYLDRGTAKIQQGQMKGIPHHLFSVLDPSEPVSVAWYQQEAMYFIDAIHARGGPPMLVGGSMLYLSSIIDGLTLAGRSDAELRRKLEEEYDVDDGETLWKKLLELDPESAANIPRENKVYVVRALEIIELTGKKKSQQRDHTALPYDLFIIGIDQDREVLRKRITERTKKMFEEGWVEEVRSLIQKGYDESAPAMQSHGYREIMQGIRSGSMDQHSLIDVISKQSVAYAKRQRTWWRKDKRIHWLHLHTAF